MAALGIFSWFNNRMMTAREAHLEPNNGTQGQFSPRDDLLGVLSKPDPLADVIIDVGGHQLYTSKYLLANASSKFREIFVDSADGNRHILPHSAARQSRARYRHVLRARDDTSCADIARTPNTLSLPDVSLNDILDMLRWVLPSETLRISDENVVSILNLAKDYEIKKLLEACDRYFFEKLEPSERNEDFMEYMTLTERFGLVYAKELAMNHLSRLTMKDLKRLCDSMGVTTRVMGEIFERRLELLDSGCLAPENANLPENFILVVDDQEIMAPSAALATASDVFKTMMKSDFLEHKTGRIYLPGKSYEAMKFVVKYILSTDHVYIPDRLLVECVGIADEYMLGRLRTACIISMISKVPKLELDECLLYLRLVSKYVLPGVEESILNVFHQQSTADILKCENYHVISAAPLILKHAQWLEKELVRCRRRVILFEI